MYACLFVFKFWNDAPACSPFQLPCPYIFALLLCINDQVEWCLTRCLSQEVDMFVFRGSMFPGIHARCTHFMHLWYPLVLLFFFFSLSLLFSSIQLWNRNFFPSCMWTIPIGQGLLLLLFLDVLKCFKCRRALDFVWFLACGIDQMLPWKGIILYWWKKSEPMLLFVGRGIGLNFLHDLKVSPSFGWALFSWLMIWSYTHNTVWSHCSLSLSFYWHCSFPLFLMTLLSLRWY